MGLTHKLGEIGDKQINTFRNKTISVHVVYYKRRAESGHEAVTEWFGGGGQGGFPEGKMRRKHQRKSQEYSEQGSSQDKVLGLGKRRPEVVKNKTKGATGACLKRKG